jgi:hypothetical protein
LVFWEDRTNGIFGAFKIGGANFSGSAQTESFKSNVNDRRFRTILHEYKTNAEFSLAAIDIQHSYSIFSYPSRPFHSSTHHIKNKTATCTTESTGTPSYLPPHQKPSHPRIRKSSPSLTIYAPRDRPLSSIDTCSTLHPAPSTIYSPCEQDEDDAMKWDGISSLQYRLSRCDFVLLTCPSNRRSTLSPSHPLHAPHSG